MSSPSASAPAAVPTNHPIAFWFFFWGELAERCSYYGMSAILLLYMADSLGISEAASSFGVSLFQAASYFTPLLGGFIADRYLGKYRTIVMFSIPYVLGNALMIIPAWPALIGALVVLALGSGVIKPNISTLMGLTYDQQRPGQDQLRSDAFSWYYFAINIGSVMSQFLMPILRNNYGANMAFLLPTILMAVALLIFALGRRFYAVETMERREKTPEERREQRIALGRLFGIFLLTVVFWSVFKHYSTVWVFFTRERIDTTIWLPIRFIQCEWIPLRLRADQFQFLNSFFILSLLPSSMLFYSWLKSRGIALRPTDKMQAGFFFVLLTPLLILACDAVAGSGKAHWGWIVTFYFAITTAEVLISPVGLELAFVAAPKSIKGFITACFLFVIFIGNLVNAVVTPLYSLKLASGERFCTPAQYFGVQAAIVAVALVAFYFVAKPFNKALAAQEQAAAAG